MSNKKLSRLLEPNLKLYFFFMAIFAVATVSVSIKLAAIELAITAVLYVYFTRRDKKRRQGVLQ